MNLSRLTKLPQTSAVFTSDGRLFSSLYDQNRLVVPLGAVSPSVVRAILAVEDRRFFRHHGVDWRGVVRAAFSNIRKFRFAEGGSTITQQLARAVVLRRSDRTLRRKVIEAVVAWGVERQIGKVQILEAYLNAAYFGHGLYGVEASALAYFGKTAAELSEQEAAYLAGVLRSPARYCRCCHSRSARERTAFVLRRVGAGVSPVRGVRRRRRPTLRARLPLTGGYVFESIRECLRAIAPELYPEKRLVVRTTIDSSCQRMVESVCRGARRAGYLGRLACVIQDAKSGAIRAFSGGADFRRHQFDTTTHGRLQPGSVLKPFVLVAALERGMTLDTKFESRPLRVRLEVGNEWIVRNAGDRYHGRISIADALVLSDNTVYAQLILEIGRLPLRRLLENVGIRLDAITPALSTGATRPGLSPLQVCSAYSIFSCDGLFFPPMLVSEVKEEGGATFCPPVQSVRACTPAIGAVVSSVLRRVTEQGTGSLQHRYRGLASKTGTSASGGWYVSYDQSFRVLTWTEGDFLEVAQTRYATKGVSAKMLADRIWRLLRAPGQVFSTLFGAFAAVDYLTVRDLLWVEEQFQLP